jgi:hypothetical protein
MNPRWQSMQEIGLGIGYLTPLSTMFQLYIGGGNRNTQRKPPTCRKSVTNLINNKEIKIFY